MALDTRGFMDGALKGYGVVKNIQNEDERMQMQRDRISEEDRRYKERRSDSLAQYNQERSDRQARYDVEDERYSKEQERLKQNDKFDRKVKGVQLKAHEATLNRENAQFQRQKKLDYLQDNMPLIQDGVKRFMKTGEVDSIFDNDHIKGGAYDPRRYTPDVVRAAYEVESMMPKVLSGEVDYRDSRFMSNVGKLLEDNVKQGIGDKDSATGKTIANKEYLRHDFVADIDPNREGDQPGVVVGLKITYDDKSTKHAPVTDNRSSDPDDTVKVIPLDRFMGEIAGQIKQSKQFFTSEHYGAVFGAKDDHSRAFEKEYRQAMLDIGKDESKALSELMDPSEEDIALVKQGFDERRQFVEKIYGKAIGSAESSPNTAIAWAGSDATKGQFINELATSYGVDPSGLSVEQLDSMYQEVITAKHTQRRNKESEQKLAKLRADQQGSGSNNNTTLASVAKSSKPSSNMYHSQFAGDYEVPPQKSLREILPEIPQGQHQGFQSRTF